MKAQEVVDAANKSFWDELCGSLLAQSIGVKNDSPESLAKFDEAYLAMYPYLLSWLPTPKKPCERLLEIGLGYGTVAQVLANRGFSFFGLDIASGPVEMAAERMRRLGPPQDSSRVTQGSALEIPYPAETFDQVVSIGCLHHTGALERAVDEVRRVLRPGGRASIMVYNAHSLGRFYLGARSLITKRRLLTDAEWRRVYDADVDGIAAPETVFTSVGAAKKLFSNFDNVHIRRENATSLRLFRWSIPRELLLSSVGRVAGLDLYVTAAKK